MFFANCNTEEELKGEYYEEAKESLLLHKTVDNLTTTIVNDIFSPPLASRVYVYPILAAYETLRHDYPNYQSLNGQIKDFKGVPMPDTSKIHVYSLAANTALMEVAKKLVYTPRLIEDYQAKLYQDYEDLGVPKSVFNRSVKYGKTVAVAILEYATGDNYKKIRGLTNYTTSQTEGAWKPTPPMFDQPIEPNWNTLRPMILDSARQFAPPPPTPYDMRDTSQFYKELMEVYEAVNNLTKEQGQIAEFWDCNPFAVEMQGHLMEPTKKISPGGHWIGIAKMAAIQSEADIMQTMEAYTMTSLALFDGFISCWDEKYNSNLIRPETVINTKEIDIDWKPLLQTPPFPEYTSGHSVVSAAASVALTQVFGDNFAYTDSVEVKFGLPIRTYTSFKAASEEAAISRLYGGIHYMPVIENGVTQGRSVGNLIVNRIKLK
jgi:hypothetical protein